MKKLACFFSLCIALFLIGCQKAADNQVHIQMTLNVYKANPENHIMSFDLSDIVEVNSTYTISSIERLTSNVGEFPYTSEFVDEADFKSYIPGIEDYLNQISSQTIPQSLPYMVLFKAKLKVTLTDGESDIVLYFFQNDTGEISGSAVAYNDYQAIDFIHYFTNEDGIDYSSIHDMQ